MAIEIHCDIYGGVSQLSAYMAYMERINAFRKKDGGVGMAQRVEVGPSQARLLEQRHEVSPHEALGM